MLLRELEQLLETWVELKQLAGSIFLGSPLGWGKMSEES